MKPVTAYIQVPCSERLPVNDEMKLIDYEDTYKQ